MSAAVPVPEQRRPPSEPTPTTSVAVATTRALLATTQIAPRATAGVVVLADAGAQPLPGLCGHRLLGSDSAVVRLAHGVLAGGQVYRSFLWPGERHGDEGDHVRITVLAARGLAPALGVALVTPHGECRGLTPRELEVLGLVIDGCSNQQVARRLAITPRTVATHVEHILVKLEVPSRTLAAVHAERDGCYVPAAAIDE